MSFYNMVHGYNSLAPLVLAMLGISTRDVPRFRDAFYDGEYLCIYTRTGGGNRDTYENKARAMETYPEYNTDYEGPWNEDLRALPGYVRDEDDDYDCTYATFYFKVPEQFAWFREWAADKTERPASERWADAIEHIKSAPKDDPLVQRVTNALRPVMDYLADATKRKEGEG